MDLDRLNFIRSLSGLEMSPERDRAVFFVHRIDVEKNCYRKQLYQLDGESELRCLSDDEHLSGLGFGRSSEDLVRGSYYFLSQRSQEEREAAEAQLPYSNVYRLDLKLGGEAQRAFRLPFAISSFKSLRDGRFLLTASYRIADEDCFGYSRAELERRVKSTKESADYHVIESMPFYLNGAGYIYREAERLFLFDPSLCSADPDEAEADDPKQKYAAYGLLPLTSLDETVEAFEVDESEKRIALVCRPNSSVMRHGASVYEIAMPELGAEDLRHEPLQTYQLALGDEELPDVEDFFYVGDALYFFINEHRCYGCNENARLYRATPTGWQPLGDNEHVLGSSVGTDVRYGASRHRRIYEGELYYLTTDRTISKIVHLNLEDGSLRTLELPLVVDGFDFNQAGEIVSIAFDEMNPQELFIHRPLASREGFEALPYDCSAFEAERYYDKRRLSDFNHSSTGEWRGIEPVFGQIESHGDAIDYFVIKPEGYDPEKSYPAILDIHGGPKTVYGGIYFFEMQYWASLGYFVFFCNPHGSDGRGNHFADIRGRYGFEDYEDIMAVYERVLEEYPAIDRERVGVTGGSYGGFMTNHIITHTDCFAAAATQRSIMNWTSFYGTSDIGYFFATDQCAVDTREPGAFEKLWVLSPMSKINEVSTPTLIIHSEEDYRCPLEQAQQLFVGLLDRGVPCRLVQFKGENHDLSRTGRIRGRRKRLDEITSWMDRFLKADAEIATSEDEEA
ncbi:MAG: S9 family peptidase [Eubacteriales bacterium]|nr:S9 family peptidase [Eubacteriales bacterium]